MAFFGAQTPMSDMRGYMAWPQVLQLIAAAPEGSRDRALLMTLALTGRRVSEIVGLKKAGSITGGLRPRDILPDRNAIVFNILKKKRPKELPFAVPSRLKAELIAYIARAHIAPDARVFPITRQRVLAIVKAYGKATGIEYVGKKKIHPHHFRHSLAIYLEPKIGIRKVAEILDHSNLNMTGVYTRFSSQDIEKDLESL